jgi:anti-anti-sigma regulatory factor
MNWAYQNSCGVNVLKLHGYLGDSALARFSGAVEWMLGTRTGPVVIDLTNLQGCSASGAAALEEAGQRAIAVGRVLAVCGCHGSAVPSGRGGQVPIRRYPDIETALDTLSGR